MVKKILFITLLLSQFSAGNIAMAGQCRQKKPILYDYNKLAVDPREGRHLYPLRTRECSCNACKNKRIKACKNSRSQQGDSGPLSKN